MTTARRRRGRQSELALAAWLRDHGFPYARARANATPGDDIEGLNTISIEVKSRRAFDPLAWLRQAHRNSGTRLPVVVLRPNGLGVESIPEWLTLLRLSDFHQLLTDAGHTAKEPAHE